MVFTDESVKRQITNSISENLTDSDLESGIKFSILELTHNLILHNYVAYCAIRGEKIYFASVNERVKYMSKMKVFSVSHTIFFSTKGSKNGFVCPT